MAINYVVSYTFAPNTTIASAQVNTNFSDNANTWTGLEALTKSFAKLKVDVDPSTSLEVATKQYVDHYSTWRRPVLQFASVSTVSIESGLDGTSGDIPILFPDGTVRTETSATRTTFDITRNTVLTTSGAQSGLRSTLTEAANTWYALYAVKITDSSTQWVTVGDTRLPLQANYSSLNTAFGASGWVYLGMIRNGDNSGATSDILTFTMAGNTTIFKNTCSLNIVTTPGIKFLGSDSGLTTLDYTLNVGTSTTDIPNHLTHAYWIWGINGGSGGTSFNDVLAHGGTHYYHRTTGTITSLGTTWMPSSEGIEIGNGSAVKLQIALAGFIDGSLGIGSNPLL